ncbi:MAG: YraN family protein [Thiotrichaceae bacterium]|nr:YraN family protein [Thiotrichaceae bacterium]
MKSKRQIGDQAEGLAQDYLEKQGLKPLCSNYSTRAGEIDLILYDPLNEQTVFVEVRYRQSSQYGGALYSVTRQKQQRIIKTAQHYMQYENPSLSGRFDVVAIEGDIEGKYSLDWIPNAFQA